MKKLVVLALIFAMTSVSMADLVSLRVMPSEVKTDYLPSDTITLQLVADFDAGSASFNKLQQDSGVVGGASNCVLSSLFDYTGIHNPGVLKNVSTDLVWAMNGSVNLGSPDVPAGTVLWSMDYHIPSVPASTNINFTFVTFDCASSDFSYEATSVNSVVLHVIPEPMTMALLGLGGLFLRRRK